MNGEIKIEIVQDENSPTKINVETNLEHDDLVMYYLIEAMVAIRNKQYAHFKKETKQD